MESGVFEQLTAALDALESENIDGIALANDLRALHGFQVRFEAQLSRRLSAFDVTREWAVDGAHSAAGWLMRWCRKAKLSAYRQTKVARQLRAMPIAKAAWESGTITSGHVEVLARVRHAAHAPEQFAAIEAALVAVAEAGTVDDVERVARQWRDALDAERQDRDSLADQQFESRHLELSEIMDGVTILNGRADPEASAYIRRAVEREYEKQHHASDERTPGQQRMDALTSICKQYLDGQTGGSNRSHVVFLTDLPTINGESVGVSETDRGVRLSPETMRRIACDSFMSSALTDATSAVLDLGRAQRTFTPEQTRALLIQYPTCTRLGCTVPASECQMHHIDWWDPNGPTDLGNGAPLCWHDHHLVHEKHWRIQRDPHTGTIDWYQPDNTHAGTVHPRNKPKPIPIHDPLRDATLTRIQALKDQHAA